MFCSSKVMIIKQAVDAFFYLHAWEWKSGDERAYEGEWVYEGEVRVWGWSESMSVAGDLEFA